MARRGHAGEYESAVRLWDSILTLTKVDHEGRNRMLMDHALEYLNARGRARLKAEARLRALVQCLKKHPHGATG